MAEHSSFSPFWHRVRTMKPRLRAHVQVVRQRYRGKRWYVVQDPTSNTYFRLSPVAQEFVGLLDGRRTIEEVWQLGLTRHGDNALTQNDVIGVLGQLHSGNLIQADMPPETEQLLSRGRERLKKKAISQAVGLMYFRVPVMNPDRFLAAAEPFFRPFISRAGFVLWALLAVGALAALAPHWEALFNGFDSAIAPANWLWLGATYVALKLWHEFGHGVVCKRFGGQVPVLGVMLLVLMPSPYVDATSAWAFPDKWRRIAVGAGGMMFELFAAALAAIGWIMTRGDGGLFHQLCYNVMLTSGVSTVLFNANPLMKFDGYYMLSDWLEIPNLMPRSVNLLKFLFQKHVYRVENANSPTTDPGEAAILLVYGVLALAYRILIFFSVTLYVMGKMFAIGLFLAAWTAAMWFILPVAQFLRWHAASPQLAHRRGRAALTSLALVGLTLALVGWVPMPDRRRANGVVEAAQRSGVFAPYQGFITHAPARGGQRVRAGEPLVVLENPELLSRLDLARAQLAESVVLEQRAASQSPAAAQAMAEQVKTFREQIAYLESKRDALTIRAPHDGVVVLPDGAERIGAFVHEGDHLCEVIDDSDLRVAAVLTQAEGDWAPMDPSAYRVEMRRVSDIDRVIEMKAVRVPAAARKDLPHAALGDQGGGTIATQRTQDGSTLAQRSVYRLHLAALPAEGGGAPEIGVPGERVRLRFTLPSRPWLAQWWERLDKTLQGRARV